jgi:hypothetical protein
MLQVPYKNFALALQDLTQGRLHAAQPRLCSFSCRTIAQARRNSWL